MRLRLRVGLVGMLGSAGLVACRPSDILSVPAPAGVVAAGALQSQAGAESAFNAAKAQLFQAVAGEPFAGLLGWSEVLTDEFTLSAFSSLASAANVDARSTAGGRGFQEAGDTPWTGLLGAHSALMLALTELTVYEPPTGRAKVGEAAALAGYTELLLAESYCAGTPLDEIVPGGGVRYGTPLTTDSLLGVAEAHFDSAVAAGQESDTIAALASVGLGRTLLDRGQYASAAQAVANVPTSFVYSAELEPDFTSGAAQLPNFYAYGILFQFGRIFNVSDLEGENGLNFISANDPRLALDTTSYVTSDGTAPWRVPIKFESAPSFIPLATGIEARLIGAEAALQNNAPGTWAADLRMLRADSLDTHVVFPAGDSLPADSAEGASAAAQVSLMFRERAFWLFGTGTRLGDLRRLIRQYGRDPSTVFPTGPYANGQNSNLPVPIPSYGTDVDLTLPTPASGTTITNPNYKGCLTSTKTA